MLTDLGRKYCDDFAGGARRARALGLDESDGLPVSPPPPPPVQPDGVLGQKAEIKHDQEQEVAENVRDQLDLDQNSARDLLDQNKPNHLNDFGIVHDPTTTVLPAQFSRGRGSNGRFVPFSREEKLRAFEAVRSWKETIKVTDVEAAIIGKMLACVVFNPERPYNQKFVGSKQEAAEFFGISEEEFTHAIESLDRRGYNIAYYYEIKGKKKVGLYVSWLAKIRNGSCS